MRLTLSVIVLAVLVAASVQAAEQVGTVTASGPFKLRGANVPATAAQALPIASGDEIETLEDAALLMLSDGSRIVLEKASKAKVHRKGAGALVCLAGGGLQFATLGKWRLEICAAERLVKPGLSSEGTVTIEGPEKVQAVSSKGTVQVDEKRACSYEGVLAKRWVPKTKVVVAVAAAGAAGAATGIVAATREKEIPPPVSPVSPR